MTEPETLTTKRPSALARLMAGFAERGLDQPD